MDKNLIIKVMTFKSGKFVFSRKYDKAKIIELLVEARVLYQTVVDLPILPNIFSQIEEEVIIRSIFGTAAIEGNPLSEERVAEILKMPDKSRIKERAEQEIGNLKTAYSLTPDTFKSELPNILSENIVKKIHETITMNIEYSNNIPGKYRNHWVQVGNKDHGGVYTPPKISKDIKPLMKEFADWINSEELLVEPPIIRAALAHYHLGLIHPFGDGNGRTARLVEAYLLRSGGVKYVPVMLSNFYYRNIDEYYWVFSKSIKDKNNKVTPFIEFVLRGFIKSLEEIKEKISFYIRKLTLNDYYKHLRLNKMLTNRQYDLLVVLLNDLSPFNIDDLFNISPFNILYRDIHSRTARRDLKKLTENNFLLLENGKYQLNFRVLG